MKRYLVAMAATLALGGAACGGDADGGNPTAPSASGSAGGGSASGGGSCARPGAPGNVTAAVSVSNVAISWSAVSGANDYQVLIGTTPETPNALNTNTTQTTYNWNGIAPGTYYVRVEARNSCGNGAPSAQVSFTVPR